MVNTASYSVGYLPGTGYIALLQIQKRDLYWFTNQKGILVILLLVDEKKIKFILSNLAKKGFKVFYDMKI